LHFTFRCSSLSYVLLIEHTTGLPIRTYIALYPICPLPYLRTACTPIPARNRYTLLTGRSLKSYIGMQSAKSGVSRVLGLPTKLISVPEATIRGCHVLTVT
jgi:hypothetical protein